MVKETPDTPSEGHANMRQVLVDYVRTENESEEDQDLFLGHTGLSVGKWVENMSHLGIYGLF